MTVDVSSAVVRLAQLESDEIFFVEQWFASFPAFA
jgi:hypothetical protein